MLPNVAKTKHYGPFSLLLYNTRLSSYSRTLDSPGFVLGFIQARAETQNISVRLDSQVAQS